jgi:hypothetical protein
MLEHFRFLGLTDFGFWLPLLISVAIIAVYHRQFRRIVAFKSFYGMLALTFIVSALSDICVSDPFSFGFRTLDLLSSFVPLMYFLLLNHGKLQTVHHTLHNNGVLMSPWLIFPLVYVGTLFADCVAITSMPAAGYTVGTTNLLADIVQLSASGQYHFLSAQYALGWIGGGGLFDGLLVIPTGAVIAAYGLAWLMRRDDSQGFVSANT